MDARNPSAFPDNERERVLHPKSVIRATRYHIGTGAKDPHLIRIENLVGLLKLPGEQTIERIFETDSASNSRPLNHARGLPTERRR